MSTKRSPILFRIDFALSKLHIYFMKMFSVFCAILLFFAEAFGLISVYFSQSVDSRFSTGEVAQGNVNLESLVAGIIDSARTSVDLCVYTLSSISIANALLRANSRGVQIRIIIDWSYVSTPAIDSLRAHGIRVITQGFGLHSDAELMHNKFMIIDYPDTAKSYLITGSFNFSDALNAENLIVIRGAHPIVTNYYAEFNQMWGGANLVPDSTRSFFGPYKSSITPHTFIVNGRLYEQYMFPQDSLAAVLKRVIATANYEIYFCIYQFTLRDVCDAMKARRDSAGVSVRGVFDQRSWSQPYSMSLLMSGRDTVNGWVPPAEVFGDSAYYSLHHKYLLIDPSYPASDPVVVTGSANWTSAADNMNDENILVIHDPVIANLYLQEFAARFIEAGGRIEPQSSPIDHILISEVFYDTPGSDAVEEWVELYNPTNTAISIGGYSLNNRNDRGTHFFIPQGYTILPRSFFVIAKDTSGFRGLGYGYDASLYGNFGLLANTGDCLILKDSLGQVVDYVAWEGGGSYGQPERWGSNTLPYANTGKSISRISLTIDTDTYADWLSNATPNPFGAISVGIDEPDDIRAVALLYPIPANNSLNIKVLGPVNAKVELYNILGQKMNVPILRDGHDTFIVNTSGMGSGLYFVVIEYPGGRRILKSLPILN